MSATSCTQQDVKTTNIDFGLKDEKGRAVGFLVRIWKRSYTKDTNGDFIHAPGDFFIGESYSTRDGQIYGSVTSLSETPSLEDIDTVIQKRMTAAKARYVKKYALPQNR